MSQTPNETSPGEADSPHELSPRRVDAVSEQSPSSHSRNSSDRTAVVVDHLPAILDSTLDIVLIVAPDGTVTYANTRLGELTGWDPEEVLGEAVFGLLREKEPGNLRQHWQAIHSGEAQEFETRLRKADGSYIPCLIAASPILGVDAYLFVMRDLTEAKNMQAKLLQAEKSAALGRLVAGAAHELNNPLTAVLGFAQILHEDTEDEKLQEDLERIIRGALRARRIVQDLLAFARQQSPVRSSTDVNETLRASLESVSIRMRRSNIILKVKLNGSLPALWANAHQLKLVWDNILTNACQAMAPQGGGTLHVNSERSGDYVRITFGDTGPGIPLANISRIFDPFFTTKGVGEGVGLGLSLCQGIIESHGGQLWVESTEGEGATFIAELPAPGKRENPSAD